MYRLNVQAETEFRHWGAPGQRRAMNAGRNAAPRRLISISKRASERVPTFVLNCIAMSDYFVEHHTTVFDIALGETRRKPVLRVADA
jgi:hypothetical protein